MWGDTRDIDWGNSGDDPFDELAPEVLPDHQTTVESGNALNSQVPEKSAEILWGNTDDHDFDFGQMAASGTTVNETNDLNMVSNVAKANPEEDLSAMWEAALD